MITVLDAPSHLGLRRPEPDREPGVRYAPWRLRELGLVTRLAAIDAGVIEAPPYTGERVDDGVLHEAAVAGYTIKLADAIGQTLEAGDFPVVLGGDTSIAMAGALAVARRGHGGLLWIDGHRDLLTPDRSRHGAAAGMALALIAGHGPEALTRIDGRQPLLSADRIVALGHRDATDWYDPAVLAALDGKLQSVALDALRVDGFATALMRSLTGLFVKGVEQIWLHLDADVLDDTVMYAVDSRQGGGMTHEELVQLLDLALGTRRIAGIDVAIYDPERDPDAACGRRLVDSLVQALARLRR